MYKAAINHMLMIHTTSYLGWIYSDSAPDGVRVGAVKSVVTIWVENISGPSNSEKRIFEAGPKTAPDARFPDNSLH